MKKFITTLVLSVLCFFSLSSMKKENPPLYVACYSSFASSWGAGVDLAKEFEKETGIRVELIDCGSGFSLIKNIENLSRPIDVVIGVDQAHISKFDEVSKGVQVVDYGYFAFVLDTRTNVREPHNLKDLCSDYYKNKFILIDPRTSLIGFGLLTLCVESYGKEEGFRLFDKLCDNALSVSPDWSTAYALFTSGEAPIVISYSTSPVYHYDNGEDYIESFELEEGALETTEYMFTLKSSKNLEAAEKFTNFVRKNSALVAMSNVMLPINLDDTRLSSGYKKISTPKKIVRSNYSDELLEEYRQWKMK